jgi:hypothetical protein
VLLHPPKNLLRLHNVGVGLDVVVSSVDTLVTFDEVVAFDLYDL